jgi:pimeloyl-ACP methyl ester carboxylesterase
MMRAIARVRLAVLILGGLLALVSVWQLEKARSGVEITALFVGQTPVTRYALPNADGPVVVIAHGFAGSRQMMQAYALPLAQAGYRAYAFDFLGHGRNPVPMSGDLTKIEGTTQVLVNQTVAVAQAFAEPRQPVALLGHSMATDIIIRAAQQLDVGPVVAISAFSGAVTVAKPDDLLVISGQWEARLREAALEYVQMIDPAAQEGMVVATDSVRRMAFVAPYTEHVSVLQSRDARRQALAWLNESYQRTNTAAVPPTGWWLVGLLAAVVALAYPLAQVLPVTVKSVTRLSFRKALLATVIPATVVPLVATTINPNWLPVLVADYLALHLALYGMLQLLLLRLFGLRFGSVSILGIAALVLWGIGAFGLALDRYGANFVPNADRLWVILALCLGTVPFMLGDAMATQGGVRSMWQRLGLRFFFFASLGGAIALDFSGLFFLLLIGPVIVLFYIVFGLMGRWTAQRAGAVSSGLGLGLILAWALGVSFPFVAISG